MRTMHTLVIGVAAAALAAFMLMDRAADATTSVHREPLPATVVVSMAVELEIEPRHWAPGSVVSRSDAAVASEQGGRVLRVVDIGQEVRSGEPLVVLDDGAVALREQEQRANLARIEAQLDLATQQERRYAQLAEQHSISHAQHDAARAEREILIQERARAQAQLAQIRHQRAQMVIRAPFAGIVAERRVELGEYLATGAAVVRLVDLASREIRVHAPLELAPFLAVGMEVPVRVGQVTHSLPVRALVPVGDDASRQLEVRIALDGPGLAVGSAVDAGLPRSSPRIAVAVPRDAVLLRREGRYVVRVDAENRAERLAVDVGIETDGWVEVRGALHAGDMLIVRGAERLPDSPSVTVNPVMQEYAAL